MLKLRTMGVITALALGCSGSTSPSPDASADVAPDIVVDARDATTGAPDVVPDATIGTPDVVPDATIGAPDVVPDATTGAPDVASDACRAADVPPTSMREIPDAAPGTDVVTRTLCGLNSNLFGRFGGRVPTLAEVSPCGSQHPWDVQRVRYEYPRCNVVVIVYQGYFQYTQVVFDRTCGAMLAASTVDDTTRGCSVGAVDLSGCGEPESCVVCAEDPRERPPPATCARPNRDAGVDDGGVDGGR